jgi:hypothetical protein
LLPWTCKEDEKEKREKEEHNSRKKAKGNGHHCIHCCDEDPYVFVHIESCFAEHNAIYYDGEQA